ncbi:MAG TPA: hypothetical protein VOA87_05400 [Thermoanaerobaculia bacterium]|nr:hypothetical protein [Thermoanaerobaculia bacterium]
MLTAQNNAKTRSRNLVALGIAAAILFILVTLNQLGIELGPIRWVLLTIYVLWFLVTVIEWFAWLAGILLGKRPLDP